MKVKKRERFYEQLQAEIKTALRHDLLIVMGDLNAKVGRDITHNNRTMGTHWVWYHEREWRELVELCTLHNLVIGGTLFPQCEIHKLTWRSLQISDPPSDDQWNMETLVTRCQDENQG